MRHIEYLIGPYTVNYSMSCRNTGAHMYWILKGHRMCVWMAGCFPPCTTGDPESLCLMEAPSSPPMFQACCAWGFKLVEVERAWEVFILRLSAFASMPSSGPWSHDIPQGEGSVDRQLGEVGMRSCLSLTKRERCFLLQLESLRFL